MGVTRTHWKVLPDVAAFLKAAGMAFPPMIGVIVLAILSFDGKSHLIDSRRTAKGFIGQVCFWLEPLLSMGTLLQNRN